ncbi:MAG: hypothetical protein EOO05_07270 [Chitinophagaceae bacterium]|nr:MAG: hypothetical protein EOO05_07270 [Chitinophagaceae bacterium]
MKKKIQVVLYLPQHLDFNPAMLAKLKVPPAWSVKVAATGTGGRHSQPWVMNAKMQELSDSMSGPSSKFTIQQAVFVPVK